MYMRNRWEPLTPGAAHFSGAAERYVQFTMTHQLLDAATWQRFVAVYRADSDTPDLGWRNEYWGKMMRGACLTYMYNGDDELYHVLETTVRDLMTVPRADGSITTYGENQFDGWDMWGRKYVLTGMLHFYRICKSEALKREILEVLTRHADAILAHVGEGEGKLPIVKTSTHWLGVNSCSILEPMLDLYRVTREPRYLAFAQYILSTGGCESEESLIELALSGAKMPFEYPEVKAYETMSFFEGVLAYYEVTGEERYLEAVRRFIRAVYKTDLTVIGCSGCTHELFDHSRDRQIVWSDVVMQETCVTVTWMRLLARMWQLTGDAAYMDWIERSTYNALYGAVNTAEEKQLSIFDGEWMDPLPFDSYSPLYNNRRGLGIGGFKRFANGGYYGCCACIASAGVALFPLLAFTRSEVGFTVNQLLPGTVDTVSPEGRRVHFTAETAYPRTADYTLTVDLEVPEAFTLALRIPAAFEDVRVQVDGEEVASQPFAGYLSVSHLWHKGARLTLSARMHLRTEQVGERTAFLYGPLVLARDEAKEEGAVDLTEQIALITEDGHYVEDWSQEPMGEELVRLTLARSDGRPPLLLTDYASAGKRWCAEKNGMTVWMNLVGNNT